MSTWYSCISSSVWSPYTTPNLTRELDMSAAACRNDGKNAVQMLHHLHIQQAMAAKGSRGTSSA